MSEVFVLTDAPFNAVGDGGVTNNLTNVGPWLDAIAAKGGVGFAPQGDYWFWGDPGGVMPGSGSVIVGGGAVPGARSRANYRRLHRLRLR